MTLLFLLSGGFVAAIVQTSTSTLTANAFYTIFLLGFGWQGAVSGVAGGPTRAKLTEEREKLTKNLGDCAEERKKLDQERRKLAQEIRECAEARKKLQAEKTSLTKKLEQYG